MSISHSGGQLNYAFLNWFLLSYLFLSPCPSFLLPGISFQKLPACKPLIKVLPLEEARLSHMAFNTMGLNEITGGLVKIGYRYKDGAPGPSNI